MSMKKRFSFIVTLLILACVALAGSSAWATPTIKPEDVRAYDKGNSVEAPFSKVSGNGTTILKLPNSSVTIYYEGTGTASDINGIIINISLLQKDGDAYPFRRSVTKYANIYPNTCTVSGSSLKGSFTISEDELKHQGGVADAIDIRITGMTNSNGEQIAKRFFIDKTAPTLIAGTATSPNPFLPDPNSQIRKFFVASVQVDPNTGSNGDSELVYYWLRACERTWKDGNSYDCDLLKDLKDKAQSTGFANPGTVYVDASTFDSAKRYDLGFMYQDQARNGQYWSSVANFNNRRNITFTSHVSTSGTLDAYTALDPNDNYRIYIPAAAITNLKTAGPYIISVNGKVARLTSGYTWTSEKISDDNWDVLTIAKATAPAALELTKESWSAADKLVVGVNNDADSLYDVYFGVDDKVGPILTDVLVDTDAAKTYLTFSESLGNRSVALDPNDIKLGTDKCTYALEYSSDNDKVIILKGVLASGKMVSVGSNSTRHIKDVKGNLAITGREVEALIGRKVKKVEVSKVDSTGTSIMITFSDEMNNATLKDPNSYWITTVPGLEDLSEDTNSDTVKDRVKKDYISVDPNIVISKTVMTLLIKGGYITDTSAAELPQVTISSYGMKTIKGSSDEKMISDNKNVVSEDAVGPYLVSATYNHHPSTTQPMGDNAKYHVLALTFSEKVKVDSLETPAYQFAFSGTGKFVSASKYTTSESTSKVVEILMADANAVAPGAGESVGVFAGSPPNPYFEAYLLGRIKDVNGKPCAYNSHTVAVKDVTVPWITAVVTNDSDNDTLLDSINVTWNTSISSSFNDAKLVASKTVVTGYADPNVSDRITFSGKVMTIKVKEKTDVDHDTASRPAVYLYFDSLNYLTATSTTDKIVKPIEISSSGVVDGIRPYQEKVTWQENTSAGADRYIVRVTYSEVIDPNVYRAPGDPNSVAGTDFQAYSKSGSAALAARTDVTVGKYVVNSCSGGTLAFNAIIPGDPNAYFAPIGDGANRRLDSVYDLRPNYALKGTSITSTAAIAAAKAGKYESISVVSPVSNHFPTSTAYTMTIHGKIIVDPNTDANTGYKVYAYSLDKLYRFRHTSKYVVKYDASTDPNGKPIQVANYTYYTDKAEHDPNCADSDISNGCTAFLAPGNDIGGVCYGSTYVNNAHGSFIMNVFGECYGTAGFNNSDPILLVVEDASGNKYLVTNTCKQDAGSDPKNGFYLEYKPDDVAEHNINLSKYESKSLTKGWNFVSFSTLKRYVVDDGKATPYEGKALEDAATNASIAASICPVVYTSNIGNVLTSLAKQWDRIYFYDGSKDSAGDALRMQPRIGSTVGAKKIEYFSIGYGYWIYVPNVRNAKLELLGNVLKDNAPQYQLSLKKNDACNNLNMVGYWGGDVYFTEAPVGVSFSTAMGDQIAVNKISDIFSSFKSAASIIKATYGVTPQSWYSPEKYPLISDYSDLRYMGPGYGYYMIINQDCKIQWPVVEVEE